MWSTVNSLVVEATTEIRLFSPRGCEFCEGD